MPQGYITKVEKDSGWVRYEGGTTERQFKHWALVAEMGGRFPPVGSYVQFREMKDPTRGPYITEIRQLTPPSAPNYGRPKNVYADPQPDPTAPLAGPGVKRIEDGEMLSLNEVAQKQAAEAAEQTKGAAKVIKPARAARPPKATHKPVEPTWDIPTTAAPNALNATIGTTTFTTTAVTSGNANITIVPVKSEP